LVLAILPCEWRGILGKRILLVDDEEIILDTYSSLLDEKGYSVVATNCGRKALEVFFSHFFDLVITDLAMPEVDGFRIIEEVKRSSPHTPVIVFTGKGHKSVKEYVSLLGAYALIEKSSSNDMFIACVKNSLKMSA
jgi:DNA-binding NtrC family response regulator